MSGQPQVLEFSAAKAVATTPHAVETPPAGWSSWCATATPEDWHAILPACLPQNGPRQDALVAAILSQPECDYGTAFLAFLLSPPLRHVFNDPLLYDVTPAQADHVYRLLGAESPAKARPEWLDLAHFRLSRLALSHARFSIGHVPQVRLLESRTESHDAALEALGLPLPAIPITEGAPVAMSRFQVTEGRLFESI